MNSARRIAIYILSLQTAIAPLAAYARFNTNVIDPEALRTISARIASGSEQFSASVARVRSRLSSEKLRGQSHDALVRIRQSPKYLAQAAEHTGQTLLVIWILSLIMAAEQDKKIKDLSASSMNFEELKAQFGLVTNKVLNGFEVFAGMAGGGAFGIAFGTPLQYLGAVVNSSVGRPILANLLNSGAASFVTFVGWELGRQLWKEAILMLDTPAEVSAANNLKISKVFSGLAGKADDPETRLFFKIFQNAWVILTFGDSEMGKAWVYNTWRLCIATGEFVTMVLTMASVSVAASAVAGVVAPGAGHVSGFVVTFFGGLAGGLAAHYLPNEVKAPITKGLRAARQNIGHSQLYTNEREIYRILSYFRSGGNSPLMPDYQFKELQNFLESRAKRRDKIMTVYYENIFQHFAREMELNMELGLVRANHAKDSDSFKKFTSGRTEELAIHRHELAGLAKSVTDFYDEETKTLQRLLGNRNWQLPTEFEKLLLAHIEKTVFQLQFSLSLLGGFMPGVLAENNIVAGATDSASLEKYLNGLYFFGYRETLIQEFITAENKNG
jgi:hypothetical protein